MAAIVTFCVIVIIYVLWDGSESVVADSAVIMSFVTILTTITSYIFASAWEDIHRIQEDAEIKKFK